MKQEKCPKPDRVAGSSIRHPPATSPIPQAWSDGRAEDSRRRLAIAGRDASAGDLAALEKFFTHRPWDNALACTRGGPGNPGHASLSAEGVGCFSPMPVKVHPELLPVLTSSFTPKGGIGSP
jgi:hypothetical protein